MAKTQIDLSNTSEELIFHFKKKMNINKPEKMNINKPEALNLCLEILSDIFDVEPNKIYKLAETKNK
jgi:hypothetical protein